MMLIDGAELAAKEEPMPVDITHATGSLFHAGRRDTPGAE
jgi:hypothetical protein